VKQGHSSKPADISAGLDDLVLLLFIAMILIDYKNFPYTFLFTFLTIIIFGELTSATSNERMTKNIIFAGATPIN